MRPLTLAAILAAAWYVFRGPPDWLGDLLNRTYAEDHVVVRDTVAPDTLARASDVAAVVGLPVKWALSLLVAGVSAEQLPAAVQETITEIKRRGPPAVGQVKAYRDAVLAAVAAKFKPPAGG